MDASQVIIGLLNSIQEIIKDSAESSVTSGFAQQGKLHEILHTFAPVLLALILYQYLKHGLIFNASLYEESEKRREEYLRKLAMQLRILAKRYGNFYFCYMPMSHGTSLPPTYSLFMAIKEVLVNSNRPATRLLRTDLLLNLIHGEHNPTRDLQCLETRDLLSFSPDETDALCEYNLDIMKCSRELIIQSVKDFDVMATVYRVLETVLEGSEE